jgi:drug/metabolite transporter (DMT)-like permease
VASSPKSARTPSKASLGADTSSISVVRTGLAAALVLLGIAWMAVYLNVAQDGQQLTWMGDLMRWNFLIGFGLIFAGLVIAAHPSTPLGRGRGVVVGMLGCFLIGLVWIVVYYITGQDMTVPVVKSLGQYNLMVGIGFMAVGFVYATHWE